MEINISLNKFAAMSYNVDDYDEQYEEYCRRYEEEEILYIDGGLPKNEYDENYWTSKGEDIRSYSPMVKKKLTKIIEACENMSHCYEGYLALGRNICANFLLKIIFISSMDFVPSLIMRIISRAASYPKRNQFVPIL